MMGHPEWPPDSGTTLNGVPLAVAFSLSLSVAGLAMWIAYVRRLARRAGVVPNSGLRMWRGPRWPQPDGRVQRSNSVDTPPISEPSPCDPPGRRLAITRSAMRLNGSDCNHTLP